MSQRSPSPFVLVSSPGMHEMATSVQKRLARRGLKLDHHKIDYTTFANKEIGALIPQTVRRQHVFFFHPLLFPDPNTAVMQMLIASNALKYASVDGITLVVPFMSYLRQDRKDKPRVPITARLLAELIEVNQEIRHVVTIDMHSEQAQGFFKIPVDNLTSMDLFAQYFKKKLGASLRDAVVVTPDLGGSKRADKFAKKLGVPVTICDKYRPAPNVSTIRAIGGASVEDRIAILYDDMLDTGGTTINAAHALKTDCGAREVYAAATHGLFSREAESRFRAANFPVAVTDSIPRPTLWLKENPWLTVVSIDDLLAKTIYEQTLRAGSVSKLSW